MACENLGVRDPFGDAEARLRWHAERAVQWLEAAASGQLLAVGHPFELPARPQLPLEEGKYGRVVHDETTASLTAWSSHYRRTGTVRFGAVSGLDGAIAVAQFEDWRGTLHNAAETSSRCNHALASEAPTGKR
jgi:hypothetical protein